MGSEPVSMRFSRRRLSKTSKILMENWRTIIVYSKFDAGVVCHKCLMTELRDEVRLRA